MKDFETLYGLAKGRTFWPVNSYVVASKKFAEVMQKELKHAGLMHGEISFIIDNFKWTAKQEEYHMEMGLSIMTVKEMCERFYHKCADILATFEDEMK